MKRSLQERALHYRELAGEFFEENMRAEILKLAAEYDEKARAAFLSAFFVDLDEYDPIPEAAPEPLNAGSD